MVRMHCKSLILQHPLTKCHIINSREMQKIKMNTDTTNQNKYNTKNTLASRPNILKKKKANPADRCRPWVWLDPLRPWVRRARQPTGLGLVGRDPSRPTYSVAHSARRNPPTAKPHPRRKPTHSARRNPPTSKPHPRRNPIHGENPPTTHVETHPHRNPIHGETPSTAKPTAKPTHSARRNPRRNPPTAHVETPSTARPTAWVSSV
jgi:hypothetical protein